jgi:hypothetical protein
VHIHAYTHDKWACRWYRLKTPLEEMERNGHMVTWGEDIPECDIFITQTWSAWSNEAASSLLAKARNMGAKVVYDLDDDYFAIDREGTTVRGLKIGVVQDFMEVFCSGADLVTTTNGILGGKLERFGTPVSVLPNMLPDAYWDISRNEWKNHRVGWMGGLGHAPDLFPTYGAIRELLHNQLSCEFHYAGSQTALSDAIPYGSVDRQISRRMVEHNKVKLSAYAQLLGYLDIGWCPLRDIEFNHSKSDLKILEYGAAGIATLASPVSPYVGFDHVTLVEDGGWYEATLPFIEDLDRRKEAGLAARAYAETRFISKNWTLWEDAYNAIL